MEQSNAERQTFKAVVRYDGTDFAGWQVQPGHRTVQGELEQALSTIARQPIRITGSGRTDSGVHALGQVFSFTWPLPLEVEPLQRSLSGLVGNDIRIESIEPAAPDFDACRSARGKRYHYTIDLARNPDPFSVRYTWHTRHAIDLDRLAALCKRIEGQHDFAGFQCSGASTSTTVRTLYTATLQQGGIIGPTDASTLWNIGFHGEGFLYKMVRNLVGTMADIARGHLPEEAIEERLASPGPYQGFTAPACGLVLVSVDY